MAGGPGKPEAVPTQSESRTVSEPWAAQAPFLEAGFQASQNEILDRPLQFFGGQTYANRAPQTQTALNMAEGRALAGSPALAAGQDQLLGTLQGDHLFNPNSNALADSVAAQVRPQVDAAFAGAGRYGSALHQGTVGREIARGLAPSMFGDYRAGRAEQLQAAGMAPGLAQADYHDIGQLGAVGAANEAFAQQGINEALARHEFEQIEPSQRLASYMGLIGGNYGGTTSGTTTGQQFYQPQTFNPLLFGLGSAVSLGSAFGPLAFL